MSKKRERQKKHRKKVRASRKSNKQKSYGRKK